MSYADGLLSTGERILHRNKQHPFIFIWGARWAVVSIAVAIALGWVVSGMDPTGVSATLATALGWVVAVLFFGGLAVFVWNALRYMNQEYVLTNRRVMEVSGVLNRQAADSSLEKINDAVLSQSIFGRMFDFGDLAVLTAADSGVERFRMIRGPIAFKKAMLDAKHEFEVDMEREGWAPGPPIRDTSSGPVSGGAGTARPGSVAMPQPSSAAASAPPAPVAPRANPDEVTRTLASLADLRDRGAITPEEFEQKKADLLSRI